VGDGNSKIFGIGLSRTGTLSLTSALETLGIETRHYPNDPRTQAELRSGRYELSLLNSVQALTDIPVAPFYAQFDRAFPGSKFILTTRSTDSWLASVENHFRMYVERRRDEFDDFVFACVYGSLHFDSERFRYVKELHEDNVRRYFGNRPDDLLILDVFHDGRWEDLCDFLDRPVPNEPFPHQNKALLAPAEMPRGRRSIRRLLSGRR
jgi:Sulfotransferase domain